MNSYTKHSLIRSIAAIAHPRCHNKLFFRQLAADTRYVISDELSILLLIQTEGGMGLYQRWKN